ncbi:MAG TPA: cytochrome P450 [Mycobacterium sp.]|jgi:cytochrome P450|nr:cytochrome P450 [Mycobacterium sp.]
MTITSDVRFARKYGPLTARTLASNMVREAKHRKRSRPVPLNIELTDFDPFDRATAADPYPRYRELLAGGPVHYNPTRSIFILTRYADVRAAARADHALPSADGVTYGRMKLPVLLTTDAPRHTRMRKQAMPAFTRGALESWQPMVDHLARKLVADMVAQSPAEVVSTLAVPMPMGMIAHILGIDQDQAAFRRWSNDTVRVADVNISKSGLRELVPAFMGFRHMHAFFTEKLSKGELLGQDTVPGRLARHTEDGRLSYDEMFFIAVLLLTAGNETTTSMLSTLFLTLAQRPDQLELLRQRRTSSVPPSKSNCGSRRRSRASYRTARVDYHVGSAVIPKGARVLLAWGAANRDPRQFADPDTFHAERNPTGHVAFGSGVHLCLGAQLARMEGQAVLREIVDNVERIDVAGKPTWTTNPNLRGLTRMTVRLTPRQQAA